MGMLQWAGDVGGAIGDGIGNAASAVADTAQSVGNTVGNTFQDVKAGLLGGDSTQEQENQKRAERAQAVGERERAALEQQNRDLEEGVSDYDPPSIEGQTNWESFSHQEIFERNRRIEPGKAEEAQRAWRDIGEQLGGLGGRFSGELRKKLSDGWEGEAAESASRAGDPLAKWMSDGGGSFELTGNRVWEASSAAGQVKDMIPEPTKPSAAETFGRGMGAALQPTRAVTDTVGQMNERQESERQAQQTMHRVLGKTFRDVDSQVPAYKDVHHKPVPPPDPPPQQNTQSLPPPVDPGQVDPAGTSSASSSSSVGSAPSVRTPSTPSVPGMPGGPGSPGGPAGSGSAWTPGGGGPGRPGPGGTPGIPQRHRQGAGDHGGGMVPAAGAGGLSGAGAAAGARGGVGGSAGGGTSAGARGAAPGAGGRAGAGAVGSGAGATGAGASGSSGAGGRGGAMGGAGAGQRGGQGGDEEEHDRPSWLEENDEVWLNDMPRVAPPVFGE